MATIRIARPQPRMRLKVRRSKPRQKFPIGNSQPHARLSLREKIKDFVWRQEELDPLTYAHEYADEAREETPILRLFGWRHSALFMPTVVSRRYRRNNSFFGVFGAKVPALIALGAILIVSGLVFSIYVAAEADKRLNDANPYVEAAFAGVVMSFFAVAIGMSIWVAFRFKSAYLTTNVFESTDEAAPWRTTAILRTPMPRLAYIDRSDRGDYFSGPTRESGARKGTVHLQIAPGDRAVDITDYNRLYELEPAHSSFTGVPLRRTHQYLDDCASSGQLTADEGKNKIAQHLQENWPWYISVGAIIGIFVTVTEQGSKGL